MRADEVHDTGSLAGTTLGELTDLARGVHTAVANRLFGFAGDAGKPIRLMHDGIAAIAYGSTKLGVKYLPPAAGLIAATFRDPTAESVHDARRGRFVLGAVNGFLGDRITEEQPSLAPQMRMRLHGGPLRRLPVNLVADAAASGTATGRLVVFIHGLCETDLCWSFAAEKRWGDRTCTYGSRLRDDDGWTALYLNFNTGLRVSANARELAEQLDEVVRSWPVPVTELALVGHSLGGLIARSAAHQGNALGHAWLEPLRHIVGLGTPNLGAPLERFANWGTHRLARLPETLPFATFLNRRSVGMKDMRYGALLEEDWLGFDPDDLLTDHCTPAVLLPGVAYSVASATLSREPHGLFAHDLLVQHTSAHGIGKVLPTVNRLNRLGSDRKRSRRSAQSPARSIPFDQTRTFHLGGRKHHFDLLADQRVYDQLRSWLGGADGAGRVAEERKLRRGRRQRRAS